MDLDLGRWICMVLEWTVSKRLGSKIDLSLLQHQSAAQEKHGSMGDSSISLLGILGQGDRRLCMRLPLHVHYRPFSVTSKQTHNHHLMATRAPRDRTLLRSECCACVIQHTNLYTCIVSINSNIVTLMFARGTCAS